MRSRLCKEYYFYTFPHEARGSFGDFVYCKGRFISPIVSTLRCTRLLLLRTLKVPHLNTWVGLHIGGFQHQGMMVAQVKGIAKLFMVLACWAGRPGS